MSEGQETGESILPMPSRAVYVKDTLRGQNDRIVRGIGRQGNVVVQSETRDFRSEKTSK